MLDRFVSLFGRLIIKCKKGNTFSRYVFNLSKYLDQAIVREVLPCVYSGEKFEGYDHVHLPYHRLSDIFNGRILPTYYEALKKLQGCIVLRIPILENYISDRPQEKRAWLKDGVIIWIQSMVVIKNLLHFMNRKVQSILKSILHIPYLNILDSRMIR